VPGAGERLPPEAHGNLVGPWDNVDELRNRILRVSWSMRMPQGLLTSLRPGRNCLRSARSFSFPKDLGQSVLAGSDSGTKLFFEYYPVLAIAGRRMEDGFITLPLVFSQNSGQAASETAALPDASTMSATTGDALADAKQARNITGA